MPTKIDYKTELKSLYAPSAKTFTLVDVPPLNFLMVDGAGNPNTSTDYSEAVSALYAVAYAIKFAVKKQLGRLYGDAIRGIVVGGRYGVVSYP